MWRRYVGCAIGFAAGAGLVWLAGFEYRLVGISGVIVAAIVMTFGERWGLVPPAEEVGKHQTLFSVEQDQPRPRDTTGYLDSIELMDEVKSDLWERVGSLTYDRRCRKGVPKVRSNPPDESACSKCSQPMRLDAVHCPHCGTPRGAAGVDAV